MVSGGTTGLIGQTQCLFTVSVLVTGRVKESRVTSLVKTGLTEHKESSEGVSSVDGLRGQI